VTVVPDVGRNIRRNPFTDLVGKRRAFESTSGGRG
jgi:hypothetical protein